MNWNFKKIVYLAVFIISKPRLNDKLSEISEEGGDSWMIEKPKPK
jgi:hypothetical protein